MATLADIRLLAQIHADQESSDFPTPAQMNILCDSAGKRVWNDLLRAGWPVDFSSVNFTSTGAASYAPAGLASGVVTVRGVFYLQGNDRYELKRVNEGQRAQLLSATAVTGFSEYFDIRVNSTGGFIIELLPRSSGQIYAVDYISAFSGFGGNDNTVWPGPNGSDELVALRVAIVAMRKEGRLDEASAKKEEYQELLQEITDMASWVNSRNPAMIRDVNSMSTRYAFDYPVAGYGSGLY